MGYGIVNTWFPVQAEAFDPAGSAAAVQASLNAHTGNKSNPHGVSPWQIGAAAASHTHDASQITAGILSAARGGTGAGSIAELAAGLILNVWLCLWVWDYSRLPGNFLGQICPQFFVVWWGLCFLFIPVFDWMRWSVEGGQRPKYYL